MQVVILAGGKGTRLRPFTTALPKPLVPVGDYPILEVILRQLRWHGFREVVISTGHLAELIEAYCGDGRRWKLRIRYVRESRPLSTAGALKLIRGLQPRFMTINGDILTTLDFGKLMREHRESRAAATLAVCERKSLVDFGVLGVDRTGRIASYTEKPVHRYLVSMGVNVFDRGVLHHIGRGECLGVPDLVRRLMQAGETVRSFRNRAEWLDIGRPEDCETAQEIFASPARRSRYIR
ncbi:MAG TPA: nucleoside-diphosphate-sugar pyrophosphorylase [Elusimicrobia bacterium]|nr:nucleoside-diphosphate-sugar pyrophosphorylase [Elusimicrobiota bacterium]